MMYLKPILLLLAVLVVMLAPAASRIRPGPPRKSNPAFNFKEVKMSAYMRRFLPLKLNCYFDKSKSSLETVTSLKITGSRRRINNTYKMIAEVTPSGVVSLSLFNGWKVNFCTSDCVNNKRMS
ncbi:hypothetical protein PoB_004227600 [Plakobranchus ocellatus]|uniref:Uncharacterized protein n=1 Tax=Plakobranchus ocellatus TaxID=259542 RepID=A0AAV4B5Q3_9GAST|nr:hypothetical protein PoB_004227600 [Plakobranchus ocellatus]